MMAEECEKLTHNLISALKKELGLNFAASKKAKQEDILDEKSDEEEGAITFE